MSRIQVNHIRMALDKMFEDKINMDDYLGKKEEERFKAYSSRALAAYSLHIIASASLTEAGQAITDGFDDNGIDAVFYDEQQNTLFIVQSKFIGAGAGEPETGDLRKFKDGIFDLIEERYSKFNEKLIQKLPFITDAFYNSKIKLNIILSYTGKGFATHNQSIISELIEKLNEATEWAYFTDFNLKFAHDALDTILDGKPVCSELSLSNWGAIEEPYTAYYGQVSAYDLAQLWNFHRKMLFSENIRNYIGMSEINSGILKTIESEPEHFFYFNNGVTILCKEITPLPAKTVGKTTGLFDCNGLSIINGAQTVGTLGMALERLGEQLTRCKVFVRLIPLNKCPENFGARITIASNTQNKIEKRDFVSLDPVQATLRTELLLTGINYHYKRSDEAIPYDENNCTLEEATVSLACYQPNTNYSVTAKREIGRLWEDINEEPYRTLFYSDLKAHILWRTVLTYRRISKILHEIKSKKSGKESGICTYGNYFILNIAFSIIPRQNIMNPSFNYTDYLNNEINKIVNEIYATACEVADELYPTSLVHQLYRNYSKCIDMKSLISEKLGFSAE